jgi:hypothetical protein
MAARGGAIFNAERSTAVRLPTFAGGDFPDALRQHRSSGDRHCRSLDRVHLARMEELKVSRLMTHDEKQAKAATEAGFKVVRPGRN